ncbi:MAG: hypothetical protein WBN11_00095 [Eudoraea sp.]|uniref:hypothetical protein n=1 Tax=Eudoraea sp. TaxID=1979955 RepID=UPI003C74714F
MSNPNQTSDVLIMMYVDTVNIKNYVPQTSENTSNVADCVFLSSNHADPDNPTQNPTDSTARTNFTTDLKGNSQISWVGAVQNMSATNLNNDSVFITGITLKTDNIGIKLRQKQDGSGDTHIDASLKNNHGSDGTETDYTISFRVWNAGSYVGDFTVDPKMKMTS